ncbi:MAG TPA: flavodoxin [Spirochaetota bacterium]|nr:flavodoxin [Spirochaetota bacterium]HPJ36461.1 flavodoxin [Spirochaetota bacterium]
MKQRLLIVYYSHSGVTGKVSSYLRKKTGGDIYEIKPARSYDPDMWKADEESCKERETGDYPPLEGEMPDLSGYDIILIGGPVWRWTLATPLMSYLMKTDFDGKIVAPFWTYISRDGAYGEEFKKSCRNAVVKEGLGLTTSEIRRSPSGWKLDEWLNSAGIILK